jgi:hypothetical protein
VTGADAIAKKTLWWTRWQTWFAGIGVLLAVLFGWSTVWRLLVATWAWLWVPQSYSLPGLFFLVLVVGLLGLILWLTRPTQLVTYAQPAIAVDENPFEYVHVVLWRARLLNGSVYEMAPHCPHCLIKINPKETYNPGPGGGSKVIEYVCDGRDCGKLKARFTGSKFEYEQRTKREIEADWLRRQRDAVVGSKP